MQVMIEPGIGNAQQSNMAGLPAFLVAGNPQQLAVTARDAQGNLTDSASQIAVMFDIPADGTAFTVQRHDPCSCECAAETCILQAVHRARVQHCIKECILASPMYMHPLA